MISSTYKVKSDSTRSNYSERIKSKPLSLKQRTSSVDSRRDYTIQSWTSLLGLVKPREYFVTVDNFSIWRRHLAWAMENGGDLRNYMTQRYASNMVFMSLLLGAELNVLFNSSTVTTHMRKNLYDENWNSVGFFAGIMILVSVILTILSLISTFTAWGMVSSVSDTNAHCILRSSIGQYVAELPGRFIVTAVYSFLVWVSLFFFLLLPVGFWSILLVVITTTLCIHVVTVFSAFGRVIMHTGAMGSERIFDEETEKRLLPHSLHAALLEKASEQLGRQTSITRQYRIKRTTHASSDIENGLSDDTPNRPRADSTVRFADTLWTSVSPRDTTRTPLSDIASQEASSQHSLVSSSDKPDRPRLPSRQGGGTTSQSDGSWLDPLRGASPHSVKEWLKAGDSTTSAADTGSKQPKPKLESPTIHGVSYSTPKSNISPSGRTFVAIPMDRSMSGHSSIGGTSFDDGQASTEDEKFDLEYGEAIYGQEQQERNDANGIDQQVTSFDLSDIEEGEQATEEQHLLPANNFQESNYSSVETSHANSTAQRNRR